MPIHIKERGTDKILKTYTGVPTPNTDAPNHIKTKDGEFIELTYDVNLTDPAGKRLRLVNKAGLILWFRDIFDIDNPNNPLPPNLGIHIYLQTDELYVASVSTAKFKVRLTAEPTRDITLKLTKNTLDVSMSPASIVFSPENWDVEREISVTDVFMNEGKFIIDLMSEQMTPEMNRAIQVYVGKMADGEDIQPPYNPNHIPVTGIMVAEPMMVIKMNETKRVPVAVTPASSSNKKIIYTSSNRNVCVVSKDGLVTPKKVGEAVITCMTQEASFQGQITVTVGAAI